jgi:hypothetical protein
MRVKVGRLWFGRFSGGAESTDVEQCSGRPSASTDETDENVSKINEMIRAYRRLMIWEIPNIWIAKFIPRPERTPVDILENQRSGKFRFRVCTEFDNWRWILGIRLRSSNESGNYHRKTQNSPRAKKVCQSKSYTKVMLIVFFFQYWRNSPSWVRASRHHCEFPMLQKSIGTPKKRRATKTAGKLEEWIWADSW